MRTHGHCEVKAIYLATMSVKACVCGENLDQDTMAGSHGSIHNRFVAIIASYFFPLSTQGTYSAKNFSEEPC